MNSDIGNRSPESAWTTLRSGGYTQSSDGLPSLPAWDTDGRPVVRFALDEHGLCRLLLPLDTGDAAGGLRGTDGLRIYTTRLEFDGKPIRFLVLTCLHRELEVVFARLAEAVITRIREGYGPIPAAVDTVERFRQLLMLPVSGSPGGNKILGLIGELHLLNRLLDLRTDAWLAWQGPNGDRHDFRAGGHAIEVKSSGSTGGNTVTIHSMEQLERPLNGSLHLLQLRMESDPAGLFTIANLGQAVLGKASCRDDVRRLIAASGCTDIEAAEWNSHRFRIIDEHYYRVDGDFPRITQSTFGERFVPGSIPRIEYDIELGSQRHHLVELDQIAALEKELIACLPAS